jgi:hypothetical protein
MKEKESLNLVCVFIISIHSDFSEHFSKNKHIIMMMAVYEGKYSLLPSASSFSAILKAKAAIVNDGFTPKEDGIIDPSTTYNPS